MSDINKKFTTLLAYAMLAAVPMCGVAKTGNGGDIEVRFPSLDRAVIKEGSYPSTENVRKMAPGLTKNQVYDLLGRPHFREGVFGVREWNYIFHFRADGKVTTCQYQVIFGSDKLTESSHWSGSACEAVLAEPQVAAASVPAPAALRVEPQPRRINLSGDALFTYSKSDLHDILVDGQTQLTAIAEQIKSAGGASVQVIGYTDRIGSYQANMALSQRRADIVRQFLIGKGVDAGSVVARGAGESSPVTQCSDSLNKSHLIACLQPDRRVELIVNAMN
ncbi:outer membrane protein assembly factor BamE domain-containing protein [Pseudomonas sp. CGJS7]|uniref:outer membrane protein assembly factor BamE domain-containing protein n=1 Tax=Pseudomonas sp. CGJS7 TaxID=3109348 RepID=UPI00300AD24C